MDDRCSALLKLQHNIGEFLELEAQLQGYRSPAKAELTDEQRQAGIKEVRGKMRALLWRTAALDKVGEPLCEVILDYLGEPEPDDVDAQLMESIRSRENMRIHSDELLVDRPRDFEA